MLAIDRDQSAIESYMVAVWLVTTATLFLFATLESRLLWWAALPIAFVLATVIPQAIIVGSALGPSSWRQRNHVELISFMHMFVMAVAAIYFAGRGTWIRYAAWAFLLLLGINAAAAVVVRLLRKRIERTENAIVSA